MIQESLRYTEIAARNVDVGRTQAAETADPTPPRTPLSSMVTTSGSAPAARGVGHRQHPARVHHRHPDALPAQPVGDLDGHRRERSHRHQQHVRGQTRRRTHQHVDPRDPLECGNVFAHFAFGEPERGRSIVDDERLAEFLTQPGAVAALPPGCPARYPAPRGPTCRCGWRRRCR